MGSKRGAFVQALTGSEVIKIPRDLMSALMVGRPGLKQKLEGLVKQHMKEIEQNWECVQHTQAEEEDTVDEEEQKLLQSINSHLDKMEEYRTSLKTDLRRRWRSRVRAVTHLQNDVQESRGKEEAAMVHDDVLRVAITKMKGLLDTETALESSSCFMLQEALEEHPECVSYMSSKDPFSLLHLACVRGLAKICSILLAHGGDSNMVTPEGMTSLHLVLLGDRMEPEIPGSRKGTAQRGRTRIPAHHSDGSLPNCRLQIMRMLIAHGAVQQRNKQGVAPLDLVTHDVPLMLLRLQL